MSNGSVMDPSGRRRVSASRQRFLGDAARPLPGDGSSGTSPVRRQSVRTTFGLDATVGGYVGAIWDSSARALRHLAKELLHWFSELWFQRDFRCTLKFSA
eukprot:jgi/Chrzof1/8240/Cz03g02200.t1